MERTGGERTGGQRYLPVTAHIELLEFMGVGTMVTQFHYLDSDNIDVQPALWDSLCLHVTYPVSN